jgi:PAS domain S-box-containing protein
MAAQQNIQPPTRLLALLLALVFFGFLSILASQFIVQRLAHKTTQLAADSHVQIYLARQLEMLVREIKADFFLLPTLPRDNDRQTARHAAMTHIGKALETAAILSNGGDIPPPEGIALLLALPPDALYTFRPDNRRPEQDTIQQINNRLQLLQQDLDRLALLPPHEVKAAGPNTPAPPPLGLQPKTIFADLSALASSYTLTSRQLLDTSRQANTEAVKRYRVIGILVAVATFLLVAFLATRLVARIIATHKVIRTTRDHMATEYKKQKALNTILAIGHEPLTLTEALAKSLEIILHSLSSNKLHEGAIFLCDHSRQKIIVQAHQGMPGQMACLRQDVPFGSCLCGMAAVSGEIIECNSLDPRHRLSYDGMATHNHFCLPIPGEQKTLGILLIHLENDLTLPQSDKDFLIAVAHSMATLIRHQMAEEKLAKSERDRLALFESSNEAILLLRNNEILQCNKAAARLFCLADPTAMVGASATDLLADRHPEAASQAFLALLTNAMQQGTAQSQCLMRRKNNATFEAALTFTPIFLYGVKVLYLVVRDISAQKEEEQALLHAKKQAENASRAKSNFLAAMSHEIRTPLTAILGMTHLTLTKPLAQDIHQNIEIIHTAADSLLALINDILDITKIEASQLLLETSPFCPLDITDKLNAIFAEQFRGAHLGFRMEIAPTIPRQLVGDPLRISQVLNNLLNNALKFTEQGEVIVRLDAPRRTDKNAVVRFTVQDSGIGIDEDTLPRIFDEFTQAKTARQFGGVGLGLAISRRLADIMGGKLWATSILGQGSTFFFEVELPLAGAEQQGRAARRDTRVIFPRAEALQGARILVVEDNDINRKVLVQILETVGACPEYARNGREAVAMIGDRHQIVLMDIEMPVMDGIQATREIRGDQRHADIPIIAMTAHAMVDDRRRCLEAGMNDYLTKPVEPVHFIDTLEKWLRVGGRPPAAPGFEGPAAHDAPAAPITPCCPAAILDMETAIAHLGGNRELYQELLADFLTLHGDTPTSLATALNQGNGEEARSLAHLLKGVAGTLRAHDLQARARAMEELLRQEGADHAELTRAADLLTEAAAILAVRINEILTR